MTNQQLRLFFGVFLSGAGAAFLYSILTPIRENHSQLLSRLCSFSGLLLLLFLLLLSSTYPYGGKRIYAQIYFSWFGVLAALLVLCSVLAGEESLLSKILSFKPLCSLGIVSLSFYLVHPLIIDALVKGSYHFLGITLLGIPLLLATTIISYFSALVLYKVIENPRSFR